MSAIITEYRKMTGRKYDQTESLKPSRNKNNGFQMQIISNCEVMFPNITPAYPINAPNDRAATMFMQPSTIGAHTSLNNPYPLM